MQLTRERIILMSVLGVATAALLLDQVLLRGGGGTPQPASADTYAADPSSAQQAEGQGETSARTNEQAQGVEPRKVQQQLDSTRATLKKEHALATRLNEFAKDRRLELPPTIDAFEPAASWVSRPTGSNKGSDEGASEPDVDVAGFIKEHKLRAVMSGRRGGLAIIEGQSEPVRLGQTLDGFKLIALDADRAVFRAGDHKAVLQLKRPGGSTDNSESGGGAD